MSETDQLNQIGTTKLLLTNISNTQHLYFRKGAIIPSKCNTRELSWISKARLQEPTGQCPNKTAACNPFQSCHVSSIHHRRPPVSLYLSKSHTLIHIFNLINSSAVVNYFFCVKTALFHCRRGCHQQHQL